MMNNFWKIKAFSLLNDSYAYVDHNSYLADQLFVQNKVKLKCSCEMVREDSPYRIIFCKVRKKDAERFEEALSRMENKMLLLGHRDYPEVCEKLTRIIDEGMKERNTR